MSDVKFFITKDIEAPHNSFFAETDEETAALGFGSKWAWADENGLPPMDEGIVFWETRAQAEEALEMLLDRPDRDDPHSFMYGAEIVAYNDEGKVLPYVPIVTQRAYTIELTVPDMIALEAAESFKYAEANMDHTDHLMYRLQGGRDTHHPGIDGLHSVEYNGHFGAAIYYTMDADLDTPAAHELVITFLTQAIIDAHKIMEERAK